MFAVSGRPSTGSQWAVNIEASDFLSTFGWRASYIYVSSPLASIVRVYGPVSVCVATGDGSHLSQQTVCPALSGGGMSKMNDFSSSFPAAATDHFSFQTFKFEEHFYMSALLFIRSVFVC